MKNIRDLIQKALELQQSGLAEGQIADELNVSRETATWLLAHSPKGDITQAPKDIYVNWSNIGRSSRRLGLMSSALCDLVFENLENPGDNIEVVVGVALSGVPMASLVAEELGCRAICVPVKQAIIRWFRRYAVTELLQGFRKEVHYCG